MTNPSPRFFTVEVVIETDDRWSEARIERVLKSVLAHQGQWWGTRIRKVEKA